MGTVEDREDGEGEASLPGRDLLVRDIRPNIVVLPAASNARAIVLSPGPGIPGAKGRRHISFIAGVWASMSVTGVWIGEGGRHRGFWIVVIMTAGFTSAMVLRWAVRQRDESCTSAAANAALLIGCICLLAGVARSSAEWRDVQRAEFGPFHGEAEIVGDSTSVGSARRVVLEIEGRRFEAWVFGASRHRVASLESGDLITVEGTRTRIDSRQSRRSLIRHVVGRFDVDEMHTVVDARHRGSALVRAANRVRNSLHRGADHMTDERASLFTGLVYGDDSSQPSSMVADFRASGLAHLTAVSGQNVVFVLSAFGPLLSRLHRSLRIAFTIVVLAWFAIMTRLEPSVVRAVLMAGVSALSTAAGRPVSTWVALCVTIGVAILVDPFLVWSVGWWLSVSGCLGLILLTTSIASLFGRWPRWVSSWAAPTIAAQAGVLGIQTAVFGWPSAVAVPCNLLAAPIAGLVMLTGLPLALVSSLIPASVATAVMWPLEAGVAWVYLVARLGAHFDLPAVVDMVVATVLLAVAGLAVLRTHTRSGLSSDGNSGEGHSNVGIWRSDGLSLQRRRLGPGERRRRHTGEIEYRRRGSIDGARRVRW